MSKAKMLGLNRPCIPNNRRRDGKYRGGAAGFPQSRCASQLPFCERGALGTGALGMTKRREAAMEWDCDG